MIKKCDQCKKENPLEDTFIYKGKTYCMQCLFGLIMAMADDGCLNLNFENAEDHGIQVDF